MLSRDNPYSLAAEADVLTGLVAVAAGRYARHGQQRPVNVIELGYWVEGARLGVWFVSQPRYESPEGPWRDGYHERGDRASFCQFFAVPSWHLLLRPAPGRRLTDHTGNSIAEPEEVAADGVGWSRELVEGIGRHLARVVADRHAEMFAGLRLEAPLLVVVFEDEDPDLFWDVRIASGVAEISPDIDAKW